jgi:hypothetical protein
VKKERSQWNSCWPITHWKCMCTLNHLVI